MSSSECLTQGPNEATAGTGESPAALLNRISYEQLTGTLLKEGVHKFAASWQQLDNTVSAALYR